MLKYKIQALYTMLVYKLLTHHADRAVRAGYLLVYKYVIITDIVYKLLVYNGCIQAPLYTTLYTSTRLYTRIDKYETATHAGSN